MGMLVRSRFPAAGPTGIADLLAGVTAEPPGGRLAVADPRVLDFLTALSTQLLAAPVARRHPELGSLGFFLRRAEIRRVADRMLATPPGALAFPRGLVFHIPPANVDTIFVYSWALSALAGNANVVRVSPRSSGAADAVLAALNESLATAHPAIAHTQRMITYGHEDEITASLSAACDLRVIWGGDRAVTEIRRHPLAPAARELTFPDRSSFAAIAVAGWRRADPATRRAAVEGFANDAYWFDQAACASPRAVFLVGDGAAAREVRDEFLTLLGQVVRGRAWTVDAAMAVQKRVATYGLAADGIANSIRFSGNEIAALDLPDAAQVPRQWLGAGTFPFATVGALTDLVPILQRTDQTLTHLGFTRDELVELAVALGGCGIDRMVPFGAALRFTAIWDGHDLPHDFTRLVTLSPMRDP